MRQTGRKDPLNSCRAKGSFPHSLSRSRHSAFGHERPFRFAPIPAVKAGISAAQKRTLQEASHRSVVPTAAVSMCSKNVLLDHRVGALLEGHRHVET
jgi:hypothetical protein